MSIILNHVTHIYSRSGNTDIKALDDVSVQIEEGEFLSVIGHTGSGKSTLVQHLNGLLKPDSGTILYDGEDTCAKGYDRVKLRFKVGLVFQYPDYQLFETDVFKDVCFGPGNLGLSKSETEARAYEALELMQLPKERWYASPFELSGGEKRRAAIAGVLAMKPRYLVLDEPTAGLDPKGRREMLDLIAGLKEKEGMGIVLVSHCMEDVAEYSDRVLVMSGGRIIMNDTPQEVFRRRQELEECGLSVPAVADIMHKLRGAGISVPDFALSVDEAAELILKSAGMIL